MRSLPFHWPVPPTTFSFQNLLSRSLFCLIWERDVRGGYCYDRVNTNRFKTTPIAERSRSLMRSFHLEITLPFPRVIPYHSISVIRSISDWYRIVLIVLLSSDSSFPCYHLCSICSSDSSTYSYADPILFPYSPDSRLQYIKDTLYA